MTPESRAWLFLNQVPCVGPVRFHQFLEKWRDAQTVLSLSAADLRAGGISADLARVCAEGFRSEQIARRVDDEIARSQRGEFAVVAGCDATYPEALKNFLDRPPVLY